MSEISRISEELKLSLDSPPKLSDRDRLNIFHQNDSLTDTINSLDSDTNKVGFLLQCGYFKASQRFFQPQNFSNNDINYVSGLLNIKNIDVKNDYPSRSKVRHRSQILEMLGILPYKESEDQFKTELNKQVLMHIDPMEIVKELTIKFKKKRLELPSNFQLASMINAAFLDSEKSSIGIVAAFFESNQEVNDLLNKMLIPFVNDEGIETKRPNLIRYKKINQSYRPQQLKRNVDTFLVFQSLFKPLSNLFMGLNLSNEIIQHYAIWILKAKTFQIKQLGVNKTSLYLACFIYHHYHLRQDALVDAMVKGIYECKNTIKKVKKKLESESAKVHEELGDVITLSRNVLQTHVNQVKEITESKSLGAEEKINKIIAVLKNLEKLEKTDDKQKINNLIEKASKAKESYDEHNLLEKYSIALQNRSASVLLKLDLGTDTSNHALLEALKYFQDKDAKIDHRAPIAFLDALEMEKLYDDSNNFKVSLYKALLITKSVEAIKSGIINLESSYKYLMVNEYLIKNKEWEESKDDLLKEAGLFEFKKASDVLAFLNKRLKFQYGKSNESIRTGNNPFISFDNDGKPIIRTPAVEKIETAKVSSLFKPVSYVSILEVLDQINKASHFTKHFKHHSIHAPKVKPELETFYAAIIGIGSNMGVHKLASTAKGISLSKVENVENWYLNKENLCGANNALIDVIDNLHLPQKLRKNAYISHTSSDGQQKKISVESLNSNQSFKYSGLSKGSSIYSFIDDRNVLFYSTVISPEEREAAYVIDGLYHNDALQSDIHSTDTHGYTEIIFGVCHLLGIAFAPRIKGVKHQTLYSFDSTTYYEKEGFKLNPKKIIQQNKIFDQWDNVLRVATSIKLRRTTASTIFKRLSSYSLENPLYTALKEFGRIVKSIYLLQYFDDVELRQSIQKQLNIVELSNKFSNAVFFDHNGEFRQETKEEQEISVLCKQLIQNAIILWNYLYLTQQLINAESDDKEQEILNVIKNGSVMSWGHINMQGIYDFRRKNDPSYSFDMETILEYLAA